MARKRWKPDLGQIKQIEALSGVGLNMEQIAGYFGVSDQTLERAIKKDAALREAIKKGRSLALAKVGETAYKMATSGKDTAMTIFWLKCKMGFKDTSKVEHTHAGPNGEPINTSPQVIISIPDNGRSVKTKND